MNKLVSIVIPVYNSESFIKNTINSILNQTYKNLELLLIDDGSKDKSLKICKEYLKKDSRVSVYESEHCGVSSVRNFGIQNAHGDYICFVDSDDLLESDYVEKLYGEIIKNNVDVVFCNYQYLYDNKKMKKTPRLNSGKYELKNVENIAIDDGTITGILFGSVCTAIYDLKIIKENSIVFDPMIKKNEDGLFNLCLLQKIRLFSVTDYDGYLYRQWKKSKRKNLNIDSETEKATEKIKECCKNFSDLKLQLNRRKVSIVFWNSMCISNAKGNIFRTLSVLKNYINLNNIEKIYPDLNFSKMNKAKKVLVYFLKRKKTFLFFCSIRYVYPLIKKVLKR